ncbi:hypothetical protein PTSG_06893 [Salpingoeca rosetta]|uniref:Uncharacterized protein n=1 Tax=Salpingoeca rosetta (strain ATCC 50818 / BSB-021) TaxID=946362 RepID=F2UF39_SALR5|nr:uncharacterized protein PTSG_06893 [Salpingoeca rosetta]EGD75239.1 hypothetical protein PTSG_06893 [Salpingoeca rosetta]|eukprot:XP_004992292.1 hypothetical protein PTSG_06893 [Salpingoeca rosetta]
MGANASRSSAAKPEPATPSKHLQARLIDPRSPSTTVPRTPLPVTSDYIPIESRDDSPLPCCDLTESCDEVDRAGERAAVNAIMCSMREAKIGQNAANAGTRQLHPIAEQGNEGDNGEEDEEDSAEADDYHAYEDAPQDDLESPTFAAIANEDERSQSSMYSSDYEDSTDQQQQGQQQQQRQEEDATFVPAPLITLKTTTNTNSHTNDITRSPGAKRQLPFAERTNLTPLRAPNQQMALQA